MENSTAGFEGDIILNKKEFLLFLEYRRKIGYFTENGVCYTEEQILNKYINENESKIRRA